MSWFPLEELHVDPFSVVLKQLDFKTVRDLRLVSHLMHNKVIDALRRLPPNRKACDAALLQYLFDINHMRTEPIPLRRYVTRAACGNLTLPACIPRLGPDGAPLGHTIRVTAPCSGLRDPMMHLVCCDTQRAASSPHPYPTPHDMSLSRMVAPCSCCLRPTNPCTPVAHGGPQMSRESTCTSLRPLLHDLVTFTHLQQIHLPGGSLPGSCWDYIIPHLTGFPRLHTLSAAYVGGNATFRALACVSSLTRLEFMYCGVTSAAPLTQLTRLRALSMRHAEDLPPEGSFAQAEGFFFIPSPPAHPKYPALLPSAVATSIEASSAVATGTEVPPPSSDAPANGAALSVFCALPHLAELELGVGVVSPAELMAAVGPVRGLTALALSTMVTQPFPPALFSTRRLASLGNLIYLDSRLPMEGEQGMHAWEGLRDATSLEYLYLSGVRGKADQHAVDYILQHMPSRCWISWVD